MDDYVYREDPCVEALRGAMERMDPYIPDNFSHNELNQWRALEVMTDEQFAEFIEVKAEWLEAKVQCRRH